MIDENLQFAISQYVDGTLPPDETAQLEMRLAGDAEARKLVAEYRRLDEMVKTARPAPEIDWEALTRKISAAVDSDAEKAPLSLVAGQGTWQSWRRPMALAAGLLVCATAAIFAWKITRTNSSPAPMVASTAVREQSYAVVNVFGTEQPVSGGEVEVQIGQAPPIAEMASAYAKAPEGRIMISALPFTVSDEDLAMLQ